MKKLRKTPLTLAMGTTAMISGFAANVNAESNPFAISELSSGYMVAVDTSNKAGSGACGGNVLDASGRKIQKSKKAAAPQNKKADGSCGEAMCGGMMDGDKMKKGMEGMCGDMMKGKEGMCGMMGGMDNMEGMDHGNQGAAKSEKTEEGSCGGMMKGKEGMCGMGHGNQEAGKSEKAEEGSCGAMMKGGSSKDEEGSCGAMMKGGEGSCGSKVDSDKAAGK